MSGVDASAVKNVVESSWKESIEQTLCQYIAIPNQSPEFDPEWETNGLLDKAANLFVSWAKSQHIAGSTIELIKDAGHTPLIFIEVAPTLPTDQTVLLYGHMDKQPPMTEKWEAGLGPHTPVIRDGKLYGRGGADDGYAIFGALTAIKALQLQKVPHARCVVIIEGCEESDQPDLSYYLAKLSARIGTPNLVVCLDSGCGNYEQLWMTSSLRGLVNVAVHVKVLEHGQHSGGASGRVVESSRVLRQLLDRVENSKDGQILIPEFNRAIPPKFVQYAKDEAKELGHQVVSGVPLLKGVAPLSADYAELLVNNTWRPTLCITGADGLPPISQAGNVLRPETAVKLSLRLPPGIDENKALAALKATLQKDVPYGAHVVIDGEDACPGWAEPDVAPWLEASVQRASKEFFGKPALRTGEGGSIPFMGMLADKFPQAQFVITGVLGPQSNAHGPNEFLNINYTKNVMGCISIVLADHFFHTQPQQK